MTSREEFSLSERTIRASLWTVGARFSSRIIDFLTLLVLARFLGPADFGLVAMAMTTIFVVEAVLELPLASALVRLPTITPQAYDTAFTLGLIRGVLVAAITVGFSVPLAAFYGDERLRVLICALAFAPAMRGMISPRMVMFEKVLDFRRKGLLEVLGKTTAAVVAVSIAVNTGSYWAIAAGTVITPTVMMVSSYVIAPMKLRLTLKEWPVFSDLIGWNFISQVLAAINWQIDRILLPRYIDIASFGRFTTASDLETLPYQSVAAPAAGTLMAAFQAARKNGTLKAAYLKSSASLAFVLMPILCFMAVLAGPVIKILLGSKWGGAAPILTGLALAGMVAVPSIPMPSLAMVLGKSRGLAVRSFAELLVRVPLSVVGVALFGIPGAIVARAGGAIAVSASSFTLTRTIAGISIRDQVSVVIRPALSLIPAVLVLFGLRFYVDFGNRLLLEVAASGILYCLTYVTFVYVFWVLARRPAGPEAIALGIASRCLRKK